MRFALLANTLSNKILTEQLKVAIKPLQKEESRCLSLENEDPDISLNTTTK